jgi:outer membrane lipoprotein SlyB
MREQAQQCALPHLIAGLAAVFIGVLLIDAVIGWSPSQDATATENLAGSTGPAPCTVCGVIQSVREVQSAGHAASRMGAGAFEPLMGSERGTQLLVLFGVLAGAATLAQPLSLAEPARIYEITIVFDNGSSRVLNNAGKTAWKPGDRVRVINGRILRSA